MPSCWRYEQAPTGFRCRGRPGALRLTGQAFDDAALDARGAQLPGNALCARPGRVAADVDRDQIENQAERETAQCSEQCPARSLPYRADKCEEAGYGASVDESELLKSDHR